MSEIEIRKTMQDELSEIVRQELNNIAPEVDLATIDPAADLREAVDIDSMDFLNLVTALHHRTGIDIPEIDYPRLVTLSGIVAYLEAKLRSAKP
jgi:acyl carrier protein